MHPDQGGTRPASGVPNTMIRIKNWARMDMKRWQRLHGALLQIYAPQWQVIDARDQIVAWAAANLALARAKNGLVRLQNLKRPLSRRESDTQKSLQADMSFWGRLVGHLEAAIPLALLQDDRASVLLLQIIDRETVEDVIGQKLQQAI
jgi:hypothetical protein